MYKPNAIHIMCDGESTSLDNNAALISLAAVRFSPATRMSYSEHFYERISLASSEAHGLHVSKATLAWWETQPLEARLEAFGGTRELVPVLDEFREFLRSFTGDTKENIILYARGYMDFVWLRSAFEAVFLDYPIGYRNEICTRSLEINVPADVLDLSPLPRSHNALDDCHQQIRRLGHIINCTRYETL